MSAWLLNKGLLTHKVSRVGRSFKRLARKKSKPSIVKQSIRVGKKLAVGVVQLATLIFIGRL